jgi:Fur family ferric uptake transcriptional regulator
MSCGSIEEFNSPRIEADQKKICAERGFELIDHVHEMYGLCPKCITEPKTEAGV